MIVEIVFRDSSDRFSNLAWLLEAAALLILYQSAHAGNNITSIDTSVLLTLINFYYTNRKQTRKNF